MTHERFRRGFERRHDASQGRVHLASRRAALQHARHLDDCATQSGHLRCSVCRRQCVTRCVLERDVPQTLAGGGGGGFCFEPADADPASLRSRVRGAFSAPGAFHHGHRGAVAASAVARRPIVLPRSSRVARGKAGDARNARRETPDETLRRAGGFGQELAGAFAARRAGVLRLREDVPRGGTLVFVRLGGGRRCRSPIARGDRSAETRGGGRGEHAEHLRRQRRVDFGAALAERRRRRRFLDARLFGVGDHGRDLARSLDEDIDILHRGEPL
mmetsp:Transcript_5832/g.24708  ORF Transcript_5832/g.24708 Transcript_5832/m.24708 type:complete len:273 (+) Transcript_5832:80-898(+)